MAIKLLKSITRETLAVTNRRNEPVMVTLKAGDLLEFRVKGRRMRMEISLAHCFNLSIIMDADHRHHVAVEDYTRKKKAGYKNLRKPKKPFLPFNGIYFKAISGK